MKQENDVVPRTLLSHAIVFVNDYESAKRVIDGQPNIKEFFLLGDNVKRFPQAQFKDGRIKVFRIRPSGSWNTLFRAMGQVEIDREKGMYANANDLMFISLIAPHDISSALNRHRAVSNITCREMHFLDTIDLPEDCAAVETLDLALRNMPSVPAPVAYSRLTIQQRFDLSSFEFARFTRPIHCINSVTNTYDARPFYIGNVFGPTFEQVGNIRHTAPAVGSCNPT